jgi:hypothetical protein
MAICCRKQHTVVENSAMAAGNTANKKNQLKMQATEPSSKATTKSEHEYQAEVRRQLTVGNSTSKRRQNTKRCKDRPPPRGQKTANSWLKAVKIGRKDIRRKHTSDRNLQTEAGNSTQ